MKKVFPQFTTTNLKITIAHTLINHTRDTNHQMENSTRGQKPRKLLNTLSN